MYCESCYMEIKTGDNYIRHRATDLCFCTMNCLTDWMVDNHAVEIETYDRDEDLIE